MCGKSNGYMVQLRKKAGVRGMLKKAGKIVLCIAVLITLLSQTAFTFQNDEWMHVQEFEGRRDFVVDRGEICGHLVKLYNQLKYGEADAEPVQTPQNRFWDLKESEYPFAMQAYALGIINGTDETTFSPKNGVLRGELALMLVRVVQKAVPGANTAGAEAMAFPDYVPDWQIPALQFAVSRGITSGRNEEAAGAYDPLTLGEAMDMIENTRLAAPEFAITRPQFRVKKAYLTFDDAVSDNTYSILDTLDRYDAKATFFLNFGADPNLLLRMRDSGHAVGNHTWSHDYAAIYSSPQSFWADFDREQQYLEGILGYSPRLMRFPGGSNNTVSHKYGGKNLMYTLAAQANEYGYLYFDWNVSSGDASGGLASKDSIVQNVLSGAKNKDSAVILMHQSKPKTTTAEALPEIIEGLRGMGFVLLPLSEDSIRPQFLK